MISNEQLTCDEQAVLERELGNFLVESRLVVFESVSLVHHHVVPLDVVQDGGVLQNQLISRDQYLQPLPAPPFQDTNPSRPLIF